MKGFVLLLVALLLATSFAFAVEGNGDAVNGEADSLGTDDGILPGDETVTDDGTLPDDAAATDDELVVAPSPFEVEESDDAVGEALVEEGAAPAVVRPAVARLHILGNGVAISSTDAFSFMHARVVVGAVKVRATAADADAFTVNRVGVLMLDAERYHLKDIAVSADEISAEIFGPANDSTAGGSAVGEIKVKRFEKPGRDIWAGNMVLNDKTYNVYFLGVKREFRLAEVAEKIGDYCKENSDDARCKNALPSCAANPEECKEKAKNFCQNNPTNVGCLQLKKAYCLRNASDERCREYLEGLCEKHPNLRHCKIREVNGEEVVGINADAVSEATAETGETIRGLVKNRIRSRIGAIRNSIESVESSVVVGNEDSARQPETAGTD